MAAPILAPDWFFMYDFFLEVIFAVITLLVSLYAFKAYRISEEKHFQLFGIGFLFISLSYFVQFFLNLLMLLEINDDFSFALNLRDVYALNLLSIYTEIFFFLIGLLFFAYMTLKVDSPRTFSLLLVLMIVAVIFSASKLFVFFLLASVLLLFIVIYYLLNYIRDRKAATFRFLLAMLFLLFSTIHFILAVNHEIFYVLGHVFELAAYILVLVNLTTVLRKNGKKKR